MKNILVFGGSGFIGRHVCEQLVAGGHRVTVPTRRAASARAVQALPMVTVQEAATLDEASLRGLVRGHDAVINLIAALHGTEAAFARLHVELPQRMARACVAEGVARFVQTSALGAAPDGPSRYLRSKAAGEAALRAIASDGALDLHIVRPSVVFGAEDRFLNLFASLQKVFPVMPLGGSDARFSPVWVSDVAQLLVKIATCPTATALDCYALHSKEQAAGAQTLRAPIEATGPDVFTLRELVQLAGRLGSSQRPVLALPESLAKLQAFFMELAPGEPLMSRDNVDSMKTPNTATPGALSLSHFGIAPSALAAIAPTYLGQQGPRALMNQQRKHAGR
jgi:uncharacterized protein YbjT (DUF2867 family)